MKIVYYDRSAPGLRKSGPAMIKNFKPKYEKKKINIFPFKHSKNV